MSSKLQDKLINFEVPPPPGSWEIIDAALDQNNNRLSQKLYQFELGPNENVWSRIEAELEGSQDSVPVVPFYRRYKKTISYAGVAAVLIAIALILTLGINQNSGRDLSTQTLVENPVLQPAGTETVQNSKLPSTGQIVDNPVSTGMQREKRSNSVSPKRDRAVGFAFMDPVQQMKNTPDQKDDKYMLFIDGDGNVMRLSKKLFNAFACAAYDYVCKERISSLQAKVASTAVTSDFTGILDILKNLQENQ